ncbi:hypothetical protein, partial [Bacillus coahuilensis]|uniref:hypothetical protein n=1 Tax=Bacillus coahuilensis TaxID=408580 RepID=UPI00018508F3
EGRAAQKGAGKRKKSTARVARGAERSEDNESSHLTSFKQITHSKSKNKILNPLTSAHIMYDAPTKQHQAM